MGLPSGGVGFPVRPNVTGLLCTATLVPETWRMTLPAMQGHWGRFLRIAASVRKPVLFDRRRKSLC